MTTDPELEEILQGASRRTTSTQDERILAAIALALPPRARRTPLPGPLMAAVIVLLVAGAAWFAAWHSSGPDASSKIASAPEQPAGMASPDAKDSPSLQAAVIATRAADPADPDIQQEILRWVEQLDDSHNAKEACDALAKIGAPAVPYLVDALAGNAQSFSNSLGTLSSMGEAGKPALVTLLAMARDKDRPEPDGWSGDTKARTRIFYMFTFDSWDWAAEAIAPTILEALSDRSESEDLRTWALQAIQSSRTLVDRARSIRAEFLDALKEIVVDFDQPDALQRDALRMLESRGEQAFVARLVSSPDDSVRSTAVELERRRSPETNSQPGADYYRRLLSERPLDPNVREALFAIKLVPNLGRLDPLTEEVKARIRSELEQRADSDAAYALAGVIQNQLYNTDLDWSYGRVFTNGFTPREDPAENHRTLREALEMSFALAKGGSERWKKAGIALAKLCLIQGDFEGMNTALLRLGQEPIAAEDRPFLHAPPQDWSNLHASWKRCEPALRSGTCSLALHVRFEGKGMAGAHLLVKEDPYVDGHRLESLGYIVDTLLNSSNALGETPQTFGYAAAWDRAKTRYAVTDSIGEARIEGLPKINVSLELSVPTANLDTACSQFELWMEAAPGVWQQLGLNAREPPASNRVPPVRITLKEGQTFQLPNFEVRRRNCIRVEPWQAVDPARFAPAWDAVPGAAERSLSYELRLLLTVPSMSSFTSLDLCPVIAENTITTPGLSWNVAEQGAGSLRLTPGNLYLLEVRALDAQGQVVANYGRVPFYVAWKHRSSSLPSKAEDFFLWEAREEIVFVGLDLAGIDRERTQLERWIDERPDAFAREYAQVIKAWLDARTGHAAEATVALENLCATLPSGCVPQLTAEWVLRAMRSTGAPPEKLRFIARPD